MGDWSRGDLLGLIALIISVATAILGTIFTLLTKHKATRNEFIQTLENAPVLTKYQTLTQSLLNILKNFFGDAESFQAFGRSFQLAYLYPIIFFVLAYSWFGGSHQFVSFDIFSEKSEWKKLTFPVFLVLLAFYYISQLVDKSHCMSNKFLGIIRSNQF